MQINLQLSKKLFNKVYYPYLTDYSHKTEVWYGGSGSGKSYFIAQKLLIKALNSERRILVIRKTQVSQKESCWKLIKDTLSNWKIYEFCKINKSDMTIELPNGSVFLFKGLDDAERIKSIVGVTDVWCEECTELTLEDYEQLTLRVRANVDNLQFFCTFNPISKANWVYKRWFESEPHEDVLVVKTTYKDNSFLPEDYIKTLEEKINTNPTYYKIYALGEFCSLDKLIYNNWKVEEFDHNKINGQLLIGLDFGFVNDPSALVASILDAENKRIYIFKEWGNTNKTNTEIAKIIESLGFRKSVIIADSAEPKSVEELKRNGIERIRESVKGQDSIIHGIQRLQQYDLIIHPDCSETITELENYSWQKDKKTNEYINKPIDMFNHYLDALRYSLQCIDTPVFSSLDKSLLGVR